MHISKKSLYRLETKWQQYQLVLGTTGSSVALPEVLLYDFCIEKCSGAISSTSHIEAFLPVIDALK